MFIKTETMPDKSRMKFFPGETVLTAGSAEFLNSEAAKRSPLATRLFEIDGVNTVMMYTDFISFLISSNDNTFACNVRKISTTIR